MEFSSVQQNDTERSDDESSVGVEVDLDPCEPSEHFWKRYRFQPKTVEALCLLLGGRLKPLARTNNAFTLMQKLCLVLQFYTTGTHQIEVGNGEGVSQHSVSRILNEVSEVLAD